MDVLDLVVKDLASVDTLRPVTGGVPVAKASAPEGTRFALQDEQERPVPVQTEVLACWDDGSARWVLLDFLSAPPASGFSRYRLTWPEPEEGIAPETPVRVREQERTPSIDAGRMAIAVTDDGRMRVADLWDVGLRLLDAAGEPCEPMVESVRIDAAGPVRSSLALRGRFRAPNGTRLFQFRLRASVYAGLCQVRLEPMILIDAEQGMFQHFRELALVFRPRQSLRTVRFGGAPGWEGTPGESVRLFQRDDRTVELPGVAGREERAPGWMEADDGRGGVAVALRDFWQQWPKSLEASREELAVGLFPRFRQGDFSHMEPWHKYQYLFEGETYRLRCGQARRWDVRFELRGDGPALARATNAPLIPIADPEQALATSVWGPLAPAGGPATADYDVWVEGLYQAYCQSIEQHRDYGAMN